MEDVEKIVPQKICTLHTDVPCGLREKSFNYGTDRHCKLSNESKFAECTYALIAIVPEDYSAN